MKCTKCTLCSWQCAAVWCAAVWFSMSALKKNAACLHFIAEHYSANVTHKKQSFPVRPWAKKSVPACVVNSPLGPGYTIMCNPRTTFENITLVISACKCNVKGTPNAVYLWAPDLEWHFFYKYSIHYYFCVVCHSFKWMGCRIALECVILVWIAPSNGNPVCLIKSCAFSLLIWLCTYVILIHWMHVMEDGHGVLWGCLMWKEK